ncbi:MAG: tetratricopeptide repeat protein [Rikenellaceae bacterium]|nr:tetratricopeptide repeat protein [Rikenellaceae bacterium]
MKRIVYLIFTLAVTLFVATDAQAQKWPERSRVRRGNRLYERLDYDRAEERYREAQQLSDTCFEATFNLGDALYKQQRFDEAEKVFTVLAADSTRNDLDRAHSYYNLGNSLFQQKKYQEALAAYKRSLRLNPADLETKYNYAYTKKYIEDNQQGGGGGGGNNNQNQDNQNNNDQKDQNSDKNKDNQQGDGENEPQDGDGDPQQGDGEPQPSGLSQNDAERMLDAIQGEEDKTRDKVNAKVGQGVVRSGKNW